MIKYIYVLLNQFFRLPRNLEWLNNLTKSVNDMNKIIVVLQKRINQLEIENQFLLDEVRQLNEIQKY
jgi:hypothetical protein